MIVSWWQRKGDGEKKKRSKRNPLVLKLIILSGIVYVTGACQRTFIASIPTRTLDHLFTLFSGGGA